MGSPQSVADQLEAFADASGVDGFNLAYAISPGSFEDFVRWVVPELQARGRMRQADGTSLTLREACRGAGSSGCATITRHPLSST
ncbi:Pristinamycin IIA synthase subunit A [Raoultella terrigena]|uniref:Pristinamycin IIA synthase subunit A n=1 Tax=Raoultella terrigena TaxID=577 RepID=A0A3P8M1G1_RAOTE|nr:Pristinamycin IIA synthase subunit A [Raoultella terrigena]